MSRLLYTPREATAPDVLNMSEETVLRLVREGHLRAIRVGRKILIPAKSIEAFTERDDAAATIPPRPRKPSERRVAAQV
jgi:excisionase family DNA binding protein